MTVTYNVLETAAETIRLRAEVERLKDRIDEHHRMFEPMRAEVERLTAQTKLDARVIREQFAEVERLTNAVRRIDGINDNPADYNPAINAVCDAILRPEPKP